MVKVRRSSFWVSEAYGLSRKIGDPRGREQGTLGQLDKQKGGVDKDKCRQLNSEVPVVACNVSRSHPIKSLDETDTNDQQLSINLKKKILSLKSLLN